MPQRAGSTDLMVNGSDINRLTGRIIGAAIEVHRRLGPGLLASTYAACMIAELRALGLHVERQVPVRIVYRDVDLECGYRIDLLVDRRVVVELKSVTALDAVHVAQAVTYLRLGGYEVGLLLNFNVVTLKAGGIRRVILSASSASSPRPLRNSVP